MIGGSNRVGGWTGDRSRSRIGSALSGRCGTHGGRAVPKGEGVPATGGGCPQPSRWGWCLHPS
ncbi:hypothetical protein BQ8420_18950 [Nocardiopsis sp. JB363]|nr:hypothetical protein BQ8420_18950 [Nocardiopsis sp. JB363]